MKNNNAVSCIFWYKRRAFRYDENTKRNVPSNNADGTPKMNDNYLSFLQVISTYWEEVRDGIFQLNVFMNGGSVSQDHDTGERTMKSGYTVTLHQTIGEPFMHQFYAWGQTFGLATQSAPRGIPTAENEQRANNRRSEGPRRSRIVDEAEFELPASPDSNEATFE